MPCSASRGRCSCCATCSTASAGSTSSSTHLGIARNVLTRAPGHARRRRPRRDPRVPRARPTGPPRVPADAGRGATCARSCSRSWPTATATTPGPDGPPAVVEHDCGAPVEVREVCADGHVLGPTDRVRTRPGPGSRRGPGAGRGRRGRRLGAARAGAPGRRARCPYDHDSRASIRARARRRAHGRPARGLRQLRRAAGRGADVPRRLGARGRAGRRGRDRRPGGRDGGADAGRPRARAGRRHPRRRRRRRGRHRRLHRVVGPRPASSIPGATTAASPPSRAPDGTWRVHWEPQDLHPRLGPGRSLALTRTLPPRAPITAADGTPLVSATPTVTVGIVPARTPDLPGVAAQLAAALHIDAAEIVADAARARPGDFVTVITLRRPDYDAVRDRIRDLPGPRSARASRSSARRRTTANRCSARSISPAPRTSGRPGPASPRPTRSGPAGSSRCSTPSSPARRRPRSTSPTRRAAPSSGWRPSPVGPGSRCAPPSTRGCSRPPSRRWPGSRRPRRSSPCGPRTVRCWPSRTPPRRRSTSRWPGATRPDPPSRS